MSTLHPQVIQGSQRPDGQSPSGMTLYRWDELYPDGTTHSFREVWVRTQAASGVIYGGVQVQEIAS